MVILSFSSLEIILLYSSSVYAFVYAATVFPVYMFPKRVKYTIDRHSQPPYYHNMIQCFPRSDFSPVQSTSRLVEAIGLLLSYSCDVGRVDLVPGSHVLLHAGGHASLLGGGEGAVGLGDALVEAVLLEFLPMDVSISNVGRGQRALRTSMRTRALARLASA